MANQALALKVNLGIGKYSAGDHFAVLGLPIDAGSAQIRKHYLNIAKTLHPDVYGKSEDESEIACVYFSRLVSPAYNTLMQEQERTEYQALLKLIVKRLMKRGEVPEPQTEVARLFAASPSVANYAKAVRSLAEVQYQFLDKSLNYTEQLSELNLVYILSEVGYKPFIPLSVAIATPISGNSGKPATASSLNSAQSATYNAASSSYRSPNPEINSTTNQASGSAKNRNGNAQAIAHLNLAENYIGQKQWTFALKELRTALQLDSSSSKCHALLGLVYVNQNLTSMAKVSFQQALKLNPNEPLALQYFKQANSDKEANSKDSKDKKSQKSGFFGWLGGGS